MIATLHMIQLELNRRATLEFAHRHDLPMLDGDLGYLLHTVMREAFQQDAPHPFAVTGSAKGVIQVLGYASAGEETLRDNLRSFARPELMHLVDPSRVASKPMPEAWVPGRRLAFEVRACPVLRQRRPQDRSRGREMDVYQAAAEKAGREATGGRERVYREWIVTQLARGGAVSDVAARLARFHRRRLVRRNARRELAASEKPDATFRGEFTVADPAAFAALLHRGVGRHRAFGLGMVLLRPPR